MRPRRVQFFEHAAWYATSNRNIDRTQILGTLVTTEFEGVDRSSGDGPPLIFVTRVTGGEFDGETRRYTTLGEAKCGHFDIVDAVLARL